MLLLIVHCDEHYEYIYLLLYLRLYIIIINVPNKMDKPNLCLFNVVISILVKLPID